MCLCPNPQEPWVERPSLIPQETDITIWYQFSIRLLLFRNCFSCCRKRALPGSHRAQGALARRRRHVTAPSPHCSGMSPPGTTPHGAHRGGKGKQGLDTRPWPELPWEGDGRVTRGASCPEDGASQGEHPPCSAWLCLSLPGHSGTVAKGTALSREYIMVFSFPF